MENKKKDCIKYLSGVYLSFKMFIRSIVLMIFLSNPYSAKASSFQDILTSLSSISCETMYQVTQLYFPQTCIPQVSTNMLASFLSPIYPWIESRLTMNNDSLFRKNCSRNNRADYYNPKIDFGFCLNYKLVPLRAAALGKVIGGLLINIFSGNNPWPDIKKDWFIEPSKYTEIHRNVPAGRMGFIVDFNLQKLTSSISGGGGPMSSLTSDSTVAIFPWKTSTINDQICVSTLSFFGWIPVGCKYMVDPYLYSKFHHFFHNAPPQDPNVAKSAITFKQFSTTCYRDAVSNTQTLLPISGPLITCINQSLVQLIVSPAIKSFDQISDVNNNVALRNGSSLYTFQSNMRLSVTALLTLYVIFIGFDILLGGGHIQKGDVIRNVVKIILVSYFAIGIHVTPNVASSARVDGMTSWILPLVFGGANQLAQIVMSLSSNNGLCYFDPNQYAPGYSYLALWDTLDCRVSNYLGLDALGSFANMTQSGTPNFNSLTFSIPPWVFLIIPAALSGNMTLIGMVLSYPFLVLSVASYMIYSFIVCSISIAILSVMSPIFIPMVLFEYTKPYFDSWAKLMLSFMLQPMIVCVFMTVMFSTFDLGFFGTCQFRSFNIASSSNTKKLFSINNDPSVYTEEQLASCVYSLGYMFNAPFSMVGNSLGLVADGINQLDELSDNSNASSSAKASPVMVTASDGSVQSIGTTTEPDQQFSDTQSNYSFLSKIKQRQGLLFSYPVLQGGIKRFALTLFTALFSLYLLYNLSSQIAAFAADMTEGIAIEGAHIKPQFGSKKKKKDKDKEGSDGEAKDTASSEESDAQDTASRGGGGGDAQDTASKGDSEGGGETKDTASKEGSEGGGETKGGDPKGDDPKGGDPKGDDPKGGDPKGDDPKGGDPKGGDPKGDDPKGGDPKGGDPKGDDPKGDDPKGSAGGEGSKKPPPTGDSSG